jgi:hypothetical protein
VEDTKRAKSIAVLVLVIAGGLFCRSMLGQIAADDDRAFAAGPKELEATTVSAGGLYELHTHCAKECRNRGDLTGAEWHERILARMRGEKVDDSIILEDTGGVHTHQASPTLLPPGSPVEDPAHRQRTTAVDADAVLVH